MRPDAAPAPEAVRRRTGSLKRTAGALAAVAALSAGIFGSTAGAALAGTDPSASGSTSGSASGSPSGASSSAAASGSVSAGGIDSTEAAALVDDLASPGLYPVRTLYRTKGNVPQGTLAAGAVGRAKLAAEAKVTAGTLAKGTSARIDYLLDQVEAAPGAYITSTGNVDVDAAGSTIGAGWMVTPDGYVVTARQLVQADDGVIRTAFQLGLIDALTKDYVRANENLATTASKEGMSTAQIQRLADLLAKWSAAKLTFPQPQSVTTLMIGKDGEEPRALATTQVDGGEAYPKAGITLLKVDVKGLSTLALAPRGTLPSGQLFVAGFDRDNQFMNDSAPQMPSRHAVAATNVGDARTSARVQVNRIASAATPADSGAPLLTPAGAALGLVLSPVPGKTQPVPVGQQIVVPINIIWSMLDANKVVPQRGPYDARYASAVHDFHAHRYKAALTGLQQIAETDPMHARASEIISAAQSAIATGQDRTPFWERVTSWVNTWFDARWLIPVLVLALLAALFRPLMRLIERRRTDNQHGPHGLDTPDREAEAPSGALPLDGETPSATIDLTGFPGGAPASADPWSHPEPPQENAAERVIGNGFGAPEVANPLSLRPATGTIDLNDAADLDAAVLDAAAEFRPAPQAIDPTPTPTRRSLRAARSAGAAEASEAAARTGALPRIDLTQHDLTGNEPPQPSVGSGPPTGALPQVVGDPDGAIPDGAEAPSRRSRRRKRHAK